MTEHPTSDTMHHPTIKSYVIGFFLSLVLTLVAYGLTVIHVGSHHTFISHEIFIPVIIAFALSQTVVQLIFFLHLWNEENPRWNLFFLISTIGVIMLVVIGSIWIMSHLNHNMTPAQMNQHILKDEGIHY